MFSGKRQIIGLDLGPARASAIVLSFGGRDEMNSVHDFASVPIEPAEGPPAMESVLAQLLGKLRTRCRECAISVWPRGAKLRLFEAEATPLAAPRKNGKAANLQTLFHEELPEYIAAVGPVASLHEAPGAAMRVATAIPRSGLEEIENALRKLRYKLQVLQLAPVAILNAFTASHATIAAEQAFVLVDLGLSAATIIAGLRGMVCTIRVVEHGWVQGSVGTGGISGQQWLSEVTREIFSVCDYLETQEHRRSLEHIYVSGALTKEAPAMKALANALQLRCEEWNPLRHARAEKRVLRHEELIPSLPFLPGAAGVAFQFAAA